MKYKHKKHRNAAILYEVLILEFTKSILRKNENLRKQLFETIKTSFSKNTLLGQELILYKTVLDSKGMDKAIIEKIVQEAKNEHEKLNKEKLSLEQNQLNFKLKKILPKINIFSNFVPNYKSLASISQIFNKDVSVKARVLLENEIINNFSSDLIQENKMIPVDNLVFNTFVKKFNESYKEFLLEEQKLLLNKYISCFSNEDISLKHYLNEEISRLKNNLTEIINTTNDSSKSSLKLVLNKINEMKNKPIDKSMIEQVLKVQLLVREIKNGN